MVLQNCQFSESMQIGKQRKPEVPRSLYWSPCLQVDIYYFITSNHIINNDHNLRIEGVEA
jgi:hypothetical protein